MPSVTRRFVRYTHGQDLIEYALPGEAFAFFLVAVASTLQTELGAWY